MKPVIAYACIAALTGALSAPAAAATCPVPNKAVDVSNIPKIDFPTTKTSPAHGTVVLHLDISAEGTVTTHKVLESTGNKDLDLAALQAARRATYTPELIECKPVAGSYLFVVVFPER
ncbi:MAG: TonB family protein [bacterium]|nr:TonB family protein [bacterium]